MTFFQTIPDALQNAEQEDLAQRSQLRRGRGSNHPHRARPHQGRNLWQNENLHPVAGDTLSLGNRDFPIKIILKTSGRSSINDVTQFLMVISTPSFILYVVLLSRRIILYSPFP